MVAKKMGISNINKMHVVHDANAQKLIFLAIEMDMHYRNTMFFLYKINNLIWSFGPCDMNCQ